MQGKGIVRFFLVILLIVTIIQLLFNLPVRTVEADADRYALENCGDEDGTTPDGTSCRAFYLDSMFNEPVLSIPGLKTYTYQELKAQQLALGLDLKGGMSVVLQVDLREFIRQLADDSKDPTFLQALELATERQSNAQDDYVTLFVDAYQELTDAPLARLFQRNPALELDLNSSDGEVARVLREQADETVALTNNLLRERIDKLGVVQPNVTLDAARDLITVELPGIDNPQRAREFLQAAAELEFWDVYRINDPGVLPAFSTADDNLRRRFGMDAPEPEYSVTPRYGIDADGNTDTTQVVGYDSIQINNPLTSGGPLLKYLAINQTGARGLGVVGTVNRSNRDTLLKLLNDDAILPLFPRNTKFVLSRNPIVDADGEETTDYDVYALFSRTGEAALTGEYITDARQDLNERGEVAVNLEMNGDGAAIWARMTEEAARNQNRQVAILLDNEVVSAPSVRGAIPGGRTEITGGFSIQEAKDLASILQVGKLPARTQIIQENIVGPSLGEKNIKDSIIALSVGFLLVLVFMVLYYGSGGVVSIIALLLNLFFIYGALTSLGVVLTLPGIAGIVLTIGMAVDANVIIYERIREELREGKSMLVAIQDGFQNSYSAIIDANVTTILTAAVLAYFGLGPIKGFAVVLIVGVISSLFTAVLVGRLLIDWWTSKGNSIGFWTPMSKNAFANMNIDWLGKRKLAYMISGAIIIFGIGSMFVKGFDLGVDFKGGYSYTVQFEGDAPSAEQIRTALATPFDGTPTVKAVDTDNTYNIVTDYLIDSQDSLAAEKVMDGLYSGINSLTPTELRRSDFDGSARATGTRVISSSKVGPTIADDITTSSVYATIFALLLIFLYIFLRFSKWQYSMGAVAALFHDTLVVLGLFSLLWGVLPFAMEIDQPFIAAILTVIGYSINDTVVVFDRIREFSNTYTQKTKEEVINMAVNSTVSRTIITSLTTLFVVTILLVFGGGSIRGFAFALFIGILVGTYSSVFIATPVMSDLVGDDLKPKTPKADPKRTFTRPSSRTTTSA